MVRNAYKTTKPQRPQRTPAGNYYLSQDLLFGAVALTNSSGQIVEAYDCEAYGSILIFTTPGPDSLWFTDDDVQSAYGANEIIYCGYRFDPETQNYYVRNRAYNPALGRWIQRDPIGYTGGTDLYEYADGRAVGAVDPSGETAIVGRFVAGMVTFSVSIWSEAQGNSPSRNHVEGDLFPSAKLLNSGRPCSKEIKAVEFAETRYFPDFGFRRADWHLDDQRRGVFYLGEWPFYAAQTPWCPGLKSLWASDDPGGYSRFDTGFAQRWRRFAVCTSGALKGASFGYASWGHEMDWTFWTRGAPEPADVHVARWVEG